MLALTAPAAAEHTSVRFWGPAGIAEAPPGEPDSATDALMRAVSELLAAVETGAAHRCDVHFARDIVQRARGRRALSEFGSAIYPFPRSGMGPVAQPVFKTGAVV